MAVMQAIISFIGRTLGRILSALLDWAVVSLFGRVTGNRKLFLWGMMAAAAAWPILLLGLVAPRAALFFFAFVPLSSRVPPGDRKSTRLNSSHGSISYAVFCLKKKK